MPQRGSVTARVVTLTGDVVRRPRAEALGMKRDTDLAEDLALLTVLLSAAGFLLTLAHVLDPVGLILLAAAATAAICSWLAPRASVGHQRLQAD